MIRLTIGGTWWLMARFGCLVMVGVGGLGGSRPLAPCALTLALSRRAGEGTVVVFIPA